MPTIFLIVIASMFAGAGLLALALWLIERRVMARPGSRLAVARRVLGVREVSR